MAHTFGAPMAHAAMGDGSLYGYPAQSFQHAQVQAFQSPLIAQSHSPFSNALGFPTLAQHNAVDSRNYSAASNIAPSVPNESQTVVPDDALQNKQQDSDVHADAKSDDGKKEKVEKRKMLKMNTEKQKMEISRSSRELPS